jgi:serine/threonine-protein kinase
VTRSCPSCGKTYPDAVFFCGEDGTITIQDQAPNDTDPRLGRQLGGYIVAARVADGAMGRVFEGRHPETKARVAIKVLHANVARDVVAEQRFVREYETTAELLHPHIVKVIEFGVTAEGARFLTMEFLEGEELGAVLGRGKPLVPARIVRILCQTALALEHAHSFGFIHRDLKPDNVFLVRTKKGDDVRVLDFGSVKMQLEMGAKLTAIGTTVGSPFYMSPEQAMGRADVDQRSDVFALGAILYEMLTDKVAFDAPNVAKILVRIMNEEPVPPSRARSECPASFDAVVAKALHKDKERRYGSPLELARAVLAAYGLKGEVADWAERSEADVAAALAAVGHRAPGALGRDEARTSDREDTTAPRVPLETASPAEPNSARSGPSPVKLGVIALLALCVLGALAVLVGR